MQNRAFRCVLTITVLAVLTLTGCALNATIGQQFDQDGNLIPYELEDPTTTKPVDAVRVRQGNTLALEFSSGPTSECFAYGVELVEDHEYVSVTIEGGLIPDAESICGPADGIKDMVAYKEAILVELSEPLGDRRVIDGSRGVTVKLGADNPSWPSNKELGIDDPDPSCTPKQVPGSTIRELC